VSITTQKNRPTKVLIDTQALQCNLRRVKSLVPNTKVMAVIKADGYGHGMTIVADALEDADLFAVNGMDDVHCLRAHGIDKPITILSEFCERTQLNDLTALNVQPTLFDFSQLSEFTNIKDDSGLSVWIKVDTGMGRLGIAPAELPQALQALAKVKGIREISCMTHLANADAAEHPSNREQLEQFENLTQSAVFRDISVLNSAGILNFSDSAATLVRPGIMLYGISPLSGVSSTQLELKPVMTFVSELVSVKQLPAGSCIGYGSTYVLAQDSLVGVVACGYGDGYPRQITSGTPVSINGMLVPIIGRVSMDLMTVDLTGVSASIGDNVELWGNNVPIETVANSAGMISYELCCGILPRVERIIINQGMRSL